MHSYETNTLRFEVKLPSNTSLAKAKTKALERSNDIFDLVIGKFLLICVDSDYDYLLCEHYETESKRTIARKIQENDYIFQTYAYSIENLKCYAESLHIVCVNATFNDTQKIDFVAFMELYSKMIYKLFLWNLLFYSKGQDDNFTLTSFRSVAGILGNSGDNEFVQVALTKLQDKINDKIIELETNFPAQKAEILALGNKLKILGLEKDNAYLFVQGHTVFDNVVLEILKPHCNKLRDENRTEIIQTAKDEIHRNNELNHYNNKVKNLKVENILATNTKFENCFLFSKIKQDIDNYMKQFS